eukprot:13906753-Ditylum_brightwellii.AAC.1
MNRSSSAAQAAARIAAASWPIAHRLKWRALFQEVLDRYLEGLIGDIVVGVRLVGPHSIRSHCAQKQSR